MQYPTTYKHEERIRQMSDLQHHTGRTPVDCYRGAKEYGGQTTSFNDYHCTPKQAMQLHSQFIQPEISAQLVYRESFELRGFDLMVESPGNNL